MESFERNGEWAECFYIHLIEVDPPFGVCSINRDTNLETEYKQARLAYNLDTEL